MKNILYTVLDFDRWIAENNRYIDDLERERDHAQGIEKPVAPPANRLPDGQVAWCEPRSTPLFTGYDVADILASI